MKERLTICKATRNEDAMSAPDAGPHARSGRADVPGFAGMGRIVLLSAGGLGDAIEFSPVIAAARRASPEAEVMLVTAWTGWIPWSA